MRDITTRTVYGLTASLLATYLYGGYLRAVRGASCSSALYRRRQRAEAHEGRQRRSAMGALEGEVAPRELAQDALAARQANARRVRLEVARVAGAADAVLHAACVVCGAACARLSSRLRLVPNITARRQALLASTRSTLGGGWIEPPAVESSACRYLASRVPGATGRTTWLAQVQW